jgi:integrator complex subunit 4
MDEGPSVSVPGLPFAEQLRAAGRGASSGSPGGPEAQVQALASISRGIYPLARAEALRGLAAVLETADAPGGVVELCHGCAVGLMRDEDEGVRLASVRLVSCYHSIGIFGFCFLDLLVGRLLEGLATMKF